MMQPLSKSEGAPTTDLLMANEAISYSERLSAEQENQASQELLAKVNALVQEGLLLISDIQETLQTQHSLKMSLLKEVNQLDQEISWLTEKHRAAGALSFTNCEAFQRETKDWENKNEVAKITLSGLREEIKAWQKCREEMKHYRYGLMCQIRHVDQMRYMEQNPTLHFSNGVPVAPLDPTTPEGRFCLKVNPNLSCYVKKP